MMVLVILLVESAMASTDEENLVVASSTVRQDLHASNPRIRLVLAMYTITFGALVVTHAGSATYWDGDERFCSG